jgi:hypothetical protein
MTALAAKAALRIGLVIPAMIAMQAPTLGTLQDRTAIVARRNRTANLVPAARPRDIAHKVATPCPRRAPRRTPHHTRHPTPRPTRRPTRRRLPRPCPRPFPQMHPQGRPQIRPLRYQPHLLRFCQPIILATKTFTIAVTQPQQFAFHVEALITVAIAWKGS